MTSNAAELELRLIARDEASKVLKGVNKEVGGLGNTLSTVGKIAGGFLAANIIAGGVGKLTGFIGDSITEGIKLGESLNAVNKIFGESAKTILDWGKNNATSFGLSQQSFNQLATPLGAILRNAGFSLDETAERTINLTKRAADMASVFNTDVDTALQAIMSGLKGEANPLEQFGVGLNAAKVEAQAMADTGKKLATDLTDLEKQTARYNLILKETATSEGDFTSTSGEAANAARIQQARTEELQATIGTKLIPVQLALTKAKLAMVDAIATHVLPALDKAGAVFKLFYDVLFKGEGVYEDFASDYTNGELQGALFSIARTLQNDVIPAINSVVAFVKAHWPEIQAVVEFVIKHVKIQIEGMIQTFQGIVAVVKGVIELVSALWHGDWSRAWEAMKAIANGVLDILEGQLKSRFGAIPQLILDALGDLSTLLKNAGMSVINGLLDGMKEGWENAKSWLSGLAPEIPKLKGPMEKDRALLEPTGAAIMDGLIVGLNSRAPALTNALQSVTNTIRRGAVGWISPDGMISGPGTHMEVLVNGVWKRGGQPPGTVWTDTRIVPGYERGTSFVPQTGLALLHRGERVSAAGTPAITVNVYVTGSILSERELIGVVRDAIQGGGLRGLVQVA